MLQYLWHGRVHISAMHRARSMASQWEILFYKHFHFHAPGQYFSRSSLHRRTCPGLPYMQESSVRYRTNIDTCLHGVDVDSTLNWQNLQGNNNCKVLYFTVEYTGSNSLKKAWVIQHFLHSCKFVSKQIKRAVSVISRNSGQSYNKRSVWCQGAIS